MRKQLLKTVWFDSINYKVKNIFKKIKGQRFSKVIKKRNDWTDTGPVGGSTAHINKTSKQQHKTSNWWFVLNRKHHFGVLAGLVFLGSTTFRCRKNNSAAGHAKQKVLLTSTTREVVFLNYCILQKGNVILCLRQIIQTKRRASEP